MSESKTRIININLPEWMLEQIDARSNRLSVPRQALIKMWIDDRLKQEQESDQRRAGNL